MTGADTLGLTGLSVTVWSLQNAVLWHLTLLGAWFLKREICWWGVTIKVKVWVGILKGPRKRFLCSLVKARELPRGTHFPWSPHNVHRKTVQIVREKMRVDPTWAKTPVFHQTNTHIQILLWNLNSTRKFTKSESFGWKRNKNKTEKKKKETDK